MRLRKILTLTTLTLVLSSALVGCKKEEVKQDKVNIGTQQEIVEPMSQIKDEEEVEEEIEEKEFTYYLPNDDAEGISKITLTGNVEENIELPQYIIDIFIKEGLLAENTKVNKFEEISEGIYNLDLSPEFYKLSFGSSTESLILSSIVNSLIENSDADKIKLTIDGYNYESGHLVMSDDDYLIFNSDSLDDNEQVININ